MSFILPQALILLLLVPAIVAVYVMMQYRRRRYALRYASVSLVREAVGNGPGIRRHIPAALYTIALIAMIFALARPQAVVPVPQNTGTIILSIDVSGSMFAEDVAPNRMEATKKAVREFVEKQPNGVKIGIVSFTESASLVAPPTTDRKVIDNAINRLRPQRGTNIGAGLQVALDAIFEGADGPVVTGPGATPTPVPNGARTPPASIVLISDGQSNLGPPPLQVAQDAVARGIRVYTIGIGTEAGAVVTVQGGGRTWTYLDETTLRGVAELTKGRYYNAQDEVDLRDIYNELARERLTEDKETELTFAFTGAALLLSLIAGGLGLLWFNRLP